jgi:hypothetical protein
LQHLPIQHLRRLLPLRRVSRQLLLFAGRSCVQPLHCSPFAAAISICALPPATPSTSPRDRKSWCRPSNGSAWTTPISSWTTSELFVFTVRSVQVARCLRLRDAKVDAKEGNIVVNTIKDWIALERVRAWVLMLAAAFTCVFQPDVKVAVKELEALFAVPLRALLRFCSETLRCRSRRSCRSLTPRNRRTPRNQFSTSSWSAEEPIIVFTNPCTVCFVIASRSKASRRSPKAMSHSRSTPTWMPRA